MEASRGRWWWRLRSGQGRAPTVTNGEPPYNALYLPAVLPVVLPTSPTACLSTFQLMLTLLVLQPPTLPAAMACYRLATLARASCQIREQEPKHH